MSDSEVSSTVEPRSSPRNGIQPYLYEPMVLNRIPQDDDDDLLSDESIGDHPQVENPEVPPSPSQFCTCGNCDRMASRKESLCCKDDQFSDVFSRTSKRRTIDGNGELVITSHALNGLCLTKSPTIKNIVEDEDLILTFLAEVSISCLRGLPKTPVSNREFRYGAYRSITRYLHGILGKRNRKILPACIIKMVRQRYPENSNNYVGYEECSDYE